VSEATTEGKSEVVVEERTEELTKEEKDAEAGFNAGFAKVRGVTPEKSDETKDEEAPKTEAAPAIQVTGVPAAKDPWEGVPAVVRERFAKLDELPLQISKLAGHVGGFKQQLNSITATAKAAAEKSGVPVPSKVEIQEALADPAKWKSLNEVYPEWMGPIESEIIRLRKDMAAAMKSVQIPASAPAAKAEPIDTAAIVAEAEERAYVRMKHPDWKAICATPDFSKAWLPKQSEDIKAKAASDLAEDAIAVFDAYKSHRQKLADDEAARLKKEKRLQGAVTVAGSPEPPSAGISDEEAFERGLKRVRGVK
jgi:hypothetical protein